jgi:hypothetical protein
VIAWLSRGPGLLRSGPPKVLDTLLLPLMILVVVALASMPTAIVLFVARLVMTVAAFVPSVLASSRRQVCSESGGSVDGHKQRCYECSRHEELNGAPQGSSPPFPFSLSLKDKTDHRTIGP